MPVPQENSLFVEQASCLFIKSLLRMVQHLRIPDLFKKSGISIGVSFISNPVASELILYQFRQQCRNDIKSALHPRA
ncbi:hypothetical protein [Microcoleus sp. OTE_8_concoct_300]|uniref:hypothetical protein n=1 Tax=Microcoleus sp. OTE_8_concoct_300 TaxID=2964710 RepID=UPI00403F57BE